MARKSASYKKIAAELDEALNEELSLMLKEVGFTSFGDSNEVYSVFSVSKCDVLVRGKFSRSSFYGELRISHKVYDDLHRVFSLDGATSPLKAGILARKRLESAVDNLFDPALIRTKNIIQASNERLSVLESINLAIKDKIRDMHV